MCAIKANSSFLQMEENKIEFLCITLKLKRVTSAYSKGTVQILFAMEVIKNK